MFKLTREREFRRYGGILGNATTDKVLAPQPNDPQCHSHAHLERFVQNVVAIIGKHLP